LSFTGEKVTATNTVSDRQDASGTTTSTSFTATLTGGTTCGRTFVAPASGAVLIHNTANGFNTGGAGFCGYEVREGGTIGSGTVFRAAADQYCLVMGANSIAMTSTNHLTGLTAGSTYNVRQMFRVSASTGTFAWKELSVQGCV
jgi:hypothetical protein